MFFGENMKEEASLLQSSALHAFANGTDSNISAAVLCSCTEHIRHSMTTLVTIYLDWKAGAIILPDKASKVERKWQNKRAQTAQQSSSAHHIFTNAPRLMNRPETTIRKRWTGLPSGRPAGLGKGRRFRWRLYRRRRPQPPPMLTRRFSRPSDRRRP